MAARHTSASGSLKLAADLETARQKNGEGRIAAHAADIASQMAPAEASKPATRTLIKTLASLLVQQEDVQELILRQGTVIRGKLNPALRAQNSLTTQISALWLKLRLTPTMDKRSMQSQAAAARGLVPVSAATGTTSAAIEALRKK